jgi:1-acyl-sn-glycerol-3-phosphate acyltransferase
MPNHQSLYDIPLLMGWLGRPVGFVFKRELLRFPGLRYWMLKIHSHAVDRGEHREAAEQYDRWGEDLAATRRALVLFPEGTRTRDPAGALGAFRRGALRLAGPRRIRILPVVIDGTRFLVRPRALALTPPERRVVRMRILPPRETQPLSPPEAKQFMEDLRDTMVAEQRAIRVNWTATAD